MRNLKKFLALVLAMMMTLSLMVTVNAKESYPDLDKADEAFVEAIDVLSGVGVIRGDETGNYNPGNNITRAEAAAIMYRVVTGDVKDDNAGLHVGVDNFTDVKGTEWFAGYVGYCVDHGIIKGRTDGRFDPSSNVTGYEMLAMLLRAIGYGQKGEFTGKGWEIPVGSRATTLGILDNVKTTSYGGNLRTAARRDVVADLVFQAMIGPATVTMSSLGDYNEYTSLVSGIKNPTLADKVFRLTSVTGIIVGNQATGETETKVGVDVSVNANGKVFNAGPSYIYATDAATDMVAGAVANATLSFDFETGLNDFGHKVKVWYDYGSYDLANPLTVGTTHTVVLNDHYSGVYAVSDKSTKTAVVFSDDGTNGTKLKAGTAANPSLGDIAKGNGFSVAIDANSGIYTSDGYDAVTAEYNSSADAGVANTNGDSDAYLLISNSGKAGDETNALDLIVSLKVSVDVIDKVNNYSKPKTVIHTTNTDEINRSVPAAKDKDLLVYGEEDISVGAGVVLNEIYGTSNDGGLTIGTNAYFGINALTEEKEGTIKAISGDGTVTLASGDTLKRSVLWNVTGGGGDTPVIGDGAAELTIGNTVTFVLDVNGDYVDCYIGDDVVMLGAYAYWTQEGIDGFKYFLQGVTNKGEIITKEVTRDSYNTAIADKAPANVDIHHMTSGTGTNGSNVSIVAPGASAAGKNGYQVYKIDGTKAVSVSAAWTKTIPASESWNAKSSVIGTTSNYFNKDTQFHVVTGWGSTLKVDTYTGLEDLLQGAASVEVAGWYFTGADDTEHVTSQNNVVKHVILVDATRIQPNTFLYSEKAITGRTEGIATVDGKAHQLMLRVAGEKDKTGILVLDGTPGTAENTTANTFYRYVLNAAGYYEITADAMDGTEYGYTSKVLTNAGTAMGDIKDADETYHAADAKVIDLTDHGINDYMSLRRAVEENAGIKVDVLLTSAGGDTASVIYVHTFA